VTRARRGPTPAASTTPTQGRALVIQPDGKIVTVGTSNDGTGGSDFALTRHRTDGTLDPTFSADRRTVTDFENSNIGHGHAVALQSNGRIVVGGYAQDDDEQS
jgi:uncharacterized delta-60 repeat protein